MNLRQLRYFVAVVEQGGMTRAAESLRIAQPALGAQIKALEEDLGTPLLLRHSRGVEPTEAGRLLFERARGILLEVKEAREAVIRRGAEPHGAIRLGLTPSLMQTIGLGLALEVRARLPNLSLGLVEEMSHRLALSLERGELDMALAFDLPDRPQFDRSALFHEDLVLVTLPESASPESVVPFALALEHRLVLPEPGDSVRSVITRTASSLGLALRVAHELRSIPAMRAMILRGECSGILPYGTVIEEVRQGRLAIRGIVAPPLRRTLHLARRSDLPRLPHETALIRLLGDALDALARTEGPLGPMLLPIG